MKKFILKIFCVGNIILPFTNNKTNVYAHEFGAIIYLSISSYAMDEYMILQDIGHLQNFSELINSSILWSLGLEIQPHTYS